MISVMYSNTAYKPNVCSHGDRKKFVVHPMGSMGDPVAGTIGLVDYLRSSGGSALMHKTMGFDLMIEKNKSRSGKLEAIKELVASGSYRIDAEKLAEKMVRNRVSLRMVN